MKRIYLNIAYVVCQKTIANIIGNGEKVKALPLKSGTNRGVHSVHSLGPVPGFLLEQDRGEKQKDTKRKGRQPSVLVCIQYGCTQKTPEDST